MKLQDLNERETLQLSMGLLGNPKYFNSSTAKDTANTFHVIQIIEDAVFTSLEDGDTDLAAGVLSGKSIATTLYSQDGFKDIEISSGIIKAVSINTIQ